MKHARLAVVLALLLGAGAARGGERVVIRDRVEVRSDFDHEPLLEKLASRVERAISVFERHVPGLSLEGRLVVHLYADFEDYERACREQGCPEMADRAGFTTIGGDSYVLLQPRKEPAYLALVGELPETTELLACHEALHQWLHKAGGAPQDALLPAWYCEGMAEHVSALCLGARALHALEKPERAREEAHLDLARLLRADAATEPRKALLYSEAATFYALLAEEPAKLVRLHAAIRALERPAGGAAAFAEECRAALEQIYGPLDALEARWRRALDGTRVEWFEDGACSEIHDAEIVCATMRRGESARLLSGRLPDQERVLVSCELELTGLGKEAEVYLGYEGRERFLRVALDEESVALESFEAGAFQERLRRHVGLDAGKWLPLRVSADRETIRVSSAGNVLLETAVPPGFDILHRRWGLGSHDGVVRFRKVQGP